MGALRYSGATDWLGGVRREDGYILGIEWEAVSASVTVYGSLWRAGVWQSKSYLLAQGLRQQPLLCELTFMQVVPEEVAIARFRSHLDNSVSRPLVTSDVEGMPVSINQIACGQCGTWTEHPIGCSPAAPKVAVCFYPRVLRKVGELDLDDPCVVSRPYGQIRACTLT